MNFRFSTFDFRLVEAKPCSGGRVGRKSLEGCGRHARHYSAADVNFPI
jgi:hypothetical protein